MQDHASQDGVARRDQLAGVAARVIDAAGSILPQLALQALLGRARLIEQDQDHPVDDDAPRAIGHLGRARCCCRGYASSAHNLSGACVSAVVVFSLVAV